MEYKQKKLSELVNGEAFEGFLLVKSAAVRTEAPPARIILISPLRTTKPP